MFFGGGGETTLMEKATVLRQQLGIAEGEPLVSVVEKATADLGLANELEGLNIQQKVDACLARLGVSGIPAAQAVPLQPVMAMPAADVVLMGRPVVEPVVPSQPGPKVGALFVHAARYGWANDIWNAAPGSGHNHAGGAKDVTDIVRRMIVNDECVTAGSAASLERPSKLPPPPTSFPLTPSRSTPSRASPVAIFGRLHINPNSQGQYMNRTFWPETSGGPAIPRKLVVRFSYGEGAVETAETPAVPNETVALHIPRTGGSNGGGGGGNHEGSAGLIATKDMEGCWICCCFPFLWWAVFKKEATGEHNLKHSGCLISPCLLPFEEHRKRIPGTNGFVKADGSDPGNIDEYASRNCVCNGLACSMKICP